MRWQDRIILWVLAAWFAFGLLLATFGRLGGALFWVWLVLLIGAWLGIGWWQTRREEALKRGRRLDVDVRTARRFRRAYAANGEAFQVPCPNCGRLGILLFQDQGTGVGVECPIWGPVWLDLVVRPPGAHESKAYADLEFADGRRERVDLGGGS